MNTQKTRKKGIGHGLRTMMINNISKIKMDFEKSNPCSDRLA